MGKTLYLDCTNGISGDMTVAALLDLGAREDVLRSALDSLPVDGYCIEISRVAKSGLDACDFNVILDREHENHDHDMAYLHGHADEGHDHALASGGHDHVHHGHDGGHHEHAHHHHGHVHRGPADLDALIDAANLSEGARELAHRIVAVLAQAEAKAHGVPLDQVHFHEVGAVDSLVDIVAAAVCVDDLGISRTVVTQLTDGHGTIRCQHGVIPVPVPATLNIVQQNGLPLGICEVEGELVTPTGAAIVAALRPEFALPARFTVERVGLGAGKRSYSRPSLLRALLIHAADPVPQDRVVRLECDIDDATGEQLAYAAERLMAAGAREAHWVPIYTKKGRPAYQLQVVAAPADVERLEGIVFAETTTIGVRRWSCDRTVLAREVATAQTPWGSVHAKRVELPGGGSRVTPEYEDCARLAREKDIPLQQVMQAARLACEA